MENSLSQQPQITELFKALPDGLRQDIETIVVGYPQIQLTAVYYEPVTDKNTKNQILAEFQEHAQPDFLKKLAAQYPQALLSIGLTDFAIKCMAMGILPHNEEGLPYKLNVDHIHDRAGCGLAGIEPQSNGLARVNQVSNLVLIDRTLHDAKTRLVNEQTKNITGPKWIVSLTPRNFPDHSNQIICQDIAQTEDLGRPVWLYRAKGAAARYEQAITALTQSAPDQSNFSELLAEATQAFAAQELMWKWAEKAHFLKEKELQGTAVTDVETLAGIANPSKETIAFLKAKQEFDLRKPPLYVSVYDPQNLVHLKRHFEDSNEIGSKFFPEKQEDVLKANEILLFGIYSKAIREGKNPGRVEHLHVWPEDVGSDAVVSREEVFMSPAQLLSFTSSRQFNVTRDKGGRNENTIDVALVEKVPTTQRFCTIAGAYGPSGKWGIYTTHPGNIAPILPGKIPDDFRENLSETIRNELKKVQTLQALRANWRTGSDSEGDEPELQLTYANLEEAIHSLYPDGPERQEALVKFIPPRIAEALDYWKEHIWLATREKLRANGVEDKTLNMTDPVSITVFRENPADADAVSRWIDTRMQEASEFYGNEQDSMLNHLFWDRLDEFLLQALKRHPNSEDFDINVLSVMVNDEYNFNKFFSSVEKPQYNQNRYGLDRYSTDEDDTRYCVVKIGGKETFDYRQTEGFYEGHNGSCCDGVMAIFDAIPGAILLTKKIKERFREEYTKYKETGNFYDLGKIIEESDLLPPVVQKEAPKAPPPPAPQAPPVVKTTRPMKPPAGNSNPLRLEDIPKLVAEADTPERAAAALLRILRVPIAGYLWEQIQPREVALLALARLGQADNVLKLYLQETRLALQNDVDADHVLGRYHALVEVCPESVGPVKRALGQLATAVESGEGGMRTTLAGKVRKILSGLGA